MALSPVLGIFAPSIKIPIVDPDTGMMTSAFHTLLAKMIERSGGPVDAVAEVDGAVVEQAADIAAVTDQVASNASNIATVTVLAQGATDAANNAQTEADGAVGGSARSGSASSPSVNLSGTGWVNGPTVNLLTVSAGDLTLTGSGPQQDSDVTMTGGNFNGEYRIMEVIGGIDTLIHTGTFTAEPGDFGGAYIYPDGSTFGVTYPRVTTGSVDYRLDARRVNGGDLTDLALYLYARRS